MSIALYRIDDRLIHGQVVIGWGQHLGVRLVVLIDDEVVAAPWEQDLYRAALPPGMEVRFAGLDEARRELPAWNADPRRTVLLAGDVATMTGLARAHPTLVREINLGGIHHRPGRVKRLPYVYLTGEEMDALTALEQDGINVVAQDVPSSSRTELRAMA